MRVLVLKGISQYNALNHYADYICDTWKNMGMIIDKINLMDEKDIIKLQNLPFKTIDFIFAFQGYGLIIKTINDEYFFEKLNKKMIAFIGDHPMYHSERLALGWNNLLFISSEKSHCNYINKYYEGTIKTACCSNLGLMNVAHVKPYKERKIEFYFPGSYERPEDRWAEIERKDTWLSLISKEMIKNLLQYTNWTLEEALERYLISLGYRLDSYEFIVLMINNQNVDRYIRAYFRDKCIRTLCEAGIKITVCGRGWEQFNCNAMENIVCLGNGDSSLEEGLDIINNSKIVFNVSPWFKNGCGGRESKVFGNGALYLTDHCTFLDENFIDGEDILFYSLNDIEKLPSIVKDILCNDEKAENIIKNGSKKAAQLFTWEKLAKEILTFVDDEYPLTEAQ